MEISIIRQVADIVTAFVAHNHLRAEELPDFLSSVHRTLVDLGKPKEVPAEKHKPAVDLPWKKTIHREYLISLIDGKHYRTLRRHLTTSGLSPDEYRARYDLPRDYPMVAAAYSEKRSALAREIGLGRKAASEDVAPAEEIDEGAVIEETPAEVMEAFELAPTKAKRGRPKKVKEAA